MHKQRKKIFYYGKIRWQKKDLYVIKNPGLNVKILDLSLVLIGNTVDLSTENFYRNQETPKEPI